MRVSNRIIPLFDDLCVREDERHGLALDARPDVEVPQVIEEGVVVVRLRDRDLERVVPRGEGRQAPEGLLPAAADADQHRVSALLLDDAVDLHQVAHGLVEEDEVHGLLRVGLVEPPEVVVRLHY